MKNGKPEDSTIIMQRGNDPTTGFTSKTFEQESPGRPPLRAIKIKGDRLRAAMHGGGAHLDWSDIHERFVDLWQEARLTLWRAKHTKAGQKQWDDSLKKYTLTFIADERLVLQSIDCVKGILDSLIKLRREMGHEDHGIPRWAIEKIEYTLRDYPEALHALLKSLAAEYDEKQVN